MENKVEGTGVEYKYGDLYIVCSKGHKTKLGENIEGGLQLLVFNKEESYVTLHCPECDKEYNLTLRLLPAENPPVEVEEAEVIEETKEETKNELQEDTTEGESI